MTSLARRASSPDGGWLLSGDKIWIGSAGWARHINLFAVAHGEADTMLGITGFCVEADAPGLILGEEHLTMGLRSMVQNSVHLDSVRVGEDTLLGRVGRGIDVAQDAMTRTRLYIAAGAIGGIKAAAALMERYASARIVAAGPLLHLPESKRKLLSAVADAEALTELVDRATPLAEAADAGRAEIFAIAKVAGTERLWAVLDDAVQLLGGRGYIETNLLPQMVRDARVLRIFEGPSETLLDFIGAAARARGAIAEFIANALGDRESAALLAATAVRGGRVPGADLELGRIATDAAMLAAGRAASSACTEILEWRLATSRARFEDVLRRSETGLAAMAAADVAAAVRACAGDIALPPVHPPGEARRIDPLLAVPEKAAEPVGTALSAPHGPPAVDGAAMTRLIADWLAGAGLTPSADRDLSFADLGMDSLRAVELTHHLEQELALELDETILWSYPTIAKLAAYLEHRRTVAPRPRQAQPAPDAAAETIAEGCW
jgi:acyl carrier protein